MILKKKLVDLGTCQVEALLFLPGENSRGSALFTHGYTSHKGSLLMWAEKMLAQNMACCLFDLPGHYLGSLHEIDQMKDFDEISSNIFSLVAASFSDILPPVKLIGGHSLGGVVALKNAHHFAKVPVACVGVGYGQGNIFESSLFKKTMAFRELLVSPCLNPQDLFQWLNREKKNLSHVRGKKIFLLSGKDDIVATPEKVENIASLLREHNEVVIEQPSHLPHHMPERGGKSLVDFLISHLSEY